MSNLSIICITNKRVEFLDDTKSILLGAVCENIFNTKYLKCDQNDNIFFKEKYYSELTFQYWFWKNKLSFLKENDWIGFCQRRRYCIKKNTLKKKHICSHAQQHHTLRRSRVRKHPLMCITYIQKIYNI